MAHLLRAIDLRLFGLPPNVSLAAIRSMADEGTKGKLKQSAIKLDDAKAAMRASKLYKQIMAEIGVVTAPYAGTNRDIEETSNEYRRIQSLAAKGDKELNKSVGLLIAECLKEDAPNITISSEKKSLPNCELKPDICLCIGEFDYICIEPSWRSTDTGILGELEGGQNTLAESHMKKYVLDKAMQYVKALEL
jgi:hypothetical protein